MRKIALALLLSIALPAFAGAAEPACKVNVNAASPEQLALLIRTGPVLAGRIAEARKAAPLTQATLDAVKGVGEAWNRDNGPHVSYQGETTCKDKLKAPKAPEPQDAKQ